MIDTSDIYANGRTHAEHCAWLDNLSDDDSIIVYTPSGYRGDLIVISQLKRALATTGMTVAERMELLEGLNKFPREYLSAAAVAAVEPACDIAIKMIHEARALNTADMWRLLGSFDVFSEFARLNPSLLAALRLCSPHSSRPSRNSTPERACA